MKIMTAQIFLAIYLCKSLHPDIHSQGFRATFPQTLGRRNNVGREIRVAELDLSSLNHPLGCLTAISSW